MAVPQRLAPSIEDLRSFYVGKEIENVPRPAAVLDRAKMLSHCDSLLEAVESLGVGFRAQVKTHKTREGARLQAGRNGNDVKLVASTIAEIEHLLPLLKEFQQEGRGVNMLYGIPLPGSQVERLGLLGRQLGQGTISVLIDNAFQLKFLERFRKTAGFAAMVYVKVDTGYHRAGLPPAKINKDNLITRLMEIEEDGIATFLGLYSHSSLSYNDSTSADAMANLEGEISGCLDALDQNATLFPRNRRRIVISVGASPQVTSIENLIDSDGALTDGARSLRETMRKVTHEWPSGISANLELHAGVYSVLDVQQLATKSRTRLGSYEEEISISVLAEVCSVYNDGERRQPEALAAVGVLGLGREPCAAYKGWGILDKGSYMAGSKHQPERRLVVERISQEHCVIAWDPEDAVEGRSDPPIPVEVGQMIRIYPNHACVTGALYGWYLVVDSDGPTPTTIVDVWIRASGW